MTSFEFFVMAIAAVTGFAIVYKIMPDHAADADSAAKRQEREQREQRESARAKTDNHDGRNKGGHSNRQDDRHEHARGNTNDRTERSAKTDARPKEWYEILGVMPNSNPDDVAQAYRALIVKYHPDKVASLGPEFQTMAEDKAKAINAAYAKYKKLKGYS